jgi:hypothetical protein
MNNKTAALVVKDQKNDNTATKAKKKLKSLQNKKSSQRL